MVYISGSQSVRRDVSVRYHCLAGVAWIKTKKAWKVKCEERDLSDYFQIDIVFPKFVPINEVTFFSLAG